MQDDMLRSMRIDLRGKYTRHRENHEAAPGGGERMRGQHIVAQIASGGHRDLTISAIMHEATMP